MGSLYQNLRRLLPRSLRRRLAENQAALDAARHLDPNLAAQSLGKVDAEWRQRIDAVLRCTDNAHIPRVAGAGTLANGTVTMHNGIQVGALGYYGEGILNMLVENHGVHEPQEERAFGEVLKHIPPGSAMLELGAYWGFYSMWFLKEVPNGRVTLVEPDPRHILSGKQNFELNGMSGTFESGYVGKATGTARDGTPVTTLDDLMQRHGIDRLAILHADIQGAELDLLAGGRKTFAERRIDFVFISTHSTELHAACLRQLQADGFAILISCDLDVTASFDGVIVAKRADLPSPTALDAEGNRPPTASPPSPLPA